MSDSITTPEGVTLDTTHDADETTEYLTAITVSNEVKRSDGDYGSDTEFASLRTAVRPALAVSGNGRAITDKIDKLAHLLDCHLDGGEDDG